MIQSLSSVKYTACQQGYTQSGKYFSKVLFSKNCEIGRCVSEIFEIQNCDIDAGVHVIPDGCNDIILAFDGTKINSFLSLSISEPYTFCFGKMKWIFGVRFYPGATYSIFHDKLENSPSNAIDVNLLLSGFSEIENSICETNSFEERVHVLNTGLEKQLKQPDATENILRYCVGRILLTGGLISIESLANETGYTGRHVRQLFLRHIGHSPKQLANIIRVQNALQHIDKMKYSNLSEAAFQFGFSDQSHMNREFRKFLNITSGSIKPDANWITRIQTGNVRHFGG